MKRLTIVLTLILALLLASSAFGQSDLYIRNGYVKGRIDGRGGIPLYWDGFLYGVYAGTAHDCIYWNYTGSGHYLLNLNGDGSPVFTVSKTGAVYAAGAISASIGLPDTNASNYMVLTWNENDTADRVLNFVLGGGNRTLTLNENLTLANGYDVTVTAEDAATAIVLDNANFEAENANATQRSIKIATGTDANATITVEGTSAVVNQDTTSDANPTFAGVNADAINIGVTAATEIDTDSGNLILDSAGGKVQIDDAIELTPSVTQVIDAVGDAILANASVVVLDPDGDYTLTSAPTIADGTTGQILYILCGNGEANKVTIQDQDTLASSNLQLLSATRTITGKSIITLVFDGTDWVEHGRGSTGNETIPLGQFALSDGASPSVACIKLADGTNKHNYWRTLGGADSQTVYWDFKGIVKGTPVSLTLYVRASDYVNLTSVTIQLWDADGNADATGSFVITPTANATWQAKTYTITSSYTANEKIWGTITITSVDTADTVDFTEITVNY